MPEVTVNGKKIKELRLEKRLTQGQLEVKSGVEQSLISRLETQSRKNVELATLGKLADALEVTISELLIQPKGKMLRDIPPETSEQVESELEDLRRRIGHIGTLLRGPASTEIPVHVGPPAGTPEAPFGDIIDSVTFPPDTVAFRVSGDSLKDIGIHPGDIVLLDVANKTPRNGQIAVVRLRTLNEVTVKQFFRENDHVRLEPANSKYKAIRARDVEVLGVVMLSMRKFG